MAGRQTERLNTALYTKMFEAQEKYRGWLLGQTPEEILNHTYEYTAREDILMALEFNELEPRQARALLALPDPLATLYHAYERTETNRMDDILDIMTDCADREAEKHVQEKKRAAREPER